MIQKILNNNQILIYNYYTQTTKQTNELPGSRTTKNRGTANIYKRVTTQKIIIRSLFYYYLIISIMHLDLEPFQF